MILTTVRQLFLSNAGFVILLDSTEDDRSLPIFIGAAEAQAIAIHLNGIDVPRPLTHDLMRQTLAELGCSVIRVEVRDLKEGTFFASILLASGNREVNVDSRPSDAIALALRCGAPIYVKESVMNEAGRLFQEDEHTMAENMAKGQESVPPTKKASTLTPLEALQANLDKCVEEERYEDAATLRDEINRVKESHTTN